MHTIICGSNQAIVMGFSAETSPKDSKNLVCVVKLHSVKALRKRINSAFEPRHWASARVKVVMAIHSKPSTTKGKFLRI